MIYEIYRVSRDKIKICQHCNTHPVPTHNNIEGIYSTQTDEVDPLGDGKSYRDPQDQKQGHNRDPTLYDFFMNQQGPSAAKIETTYEKIKICHE